MKITKNKIAIACLVPFLLFTAGSFLGHDKDGFSMAASLYGMPLVIVAVALFFSSAVSVIIKKIEEGGFSRKILHTFTILFFSVVILVVFYFLFFKFSSLPWYLG